MKNIRLDIRLRARVKIHLWEYVVKDVRWEIVNYFSSSIAERVQNQVRHNVVGALSETS